MLSFGLVWREQGRIAPVVVLSEEQEAELTKLLRSRLTSVRLAQRARIGVESEPNRGRSIHAARRALGEFSAAEVLVNTASFLTENSSLRTATLIRQQPTVASHWLNL